MGKKRGKKNVSIREKQKEFADGTTWLGSEAVGVSWGAGLVESGTGEQLCCLQGRGGEGQWEIRVEGARKRPS